LGIFLYFPFSSERYDCIIFAFNICIFFQILCVQSDFWNYGIFIQCVESFLSSQFSSETIDLTLFPVSSCTFSKIRYILVPVFYFGRLRPWLVTFLCFLFSSESIALYFHSIFAVSSKSSCVQEPFLNFGIFSQCVVIFSYIRFSSEAAIQWGLHSFHGNSSKFTVFRWLSLMYAYSGSI